VWMWSGSVEWTGKGGAFASIYGLEDILTGKGKKGLLRNWQLDLHSRLGFSQVMLFLPVRPGMDRETGEISTFLYRYL